MKYSIKFAFSLSLLVMTTIACSSGSGETTLAEEESSSAPVDQTATVEGTVAEEQAAPESTDEEQPEDTTSGTIATEQIGYGHYMDSAYLEVVQKNMNGNQRNEYSESQLFNYARNTCTYLRAGNWQKVLDLVETMKGTDDFSFVTAMTGSAIYAYCEESENPFMDEAAKRGL